MTINTSKTQHSLTREQKEAVGLLSIGTFLEYFDLMLYIHMAILMNDLFFPQTDPFTSSLFLAFAFWSTYLLRPFGAIIFGYIGDKIGRKTTVVITTLMMSIACIVMVLVKTYEEIGITASIIVTLCRMIQGMSCVGEVSGAELYLTEMIKPPLQYPAVTAVTVLSVLGATTALGVASYVTSSDEANWRIAFMIGACIAIVGFFARTKLKETPDFVDAKRKMKLFLSANNNNLEDSKIYKNIMNKKVNVKTTISYFLIRCAWPACFYFVFIHCANLYKTTFDFTANQVIHQNFLVSMCELLMAIFLLLLSRIVYPLKILKTILCIYSIFILASPYLFSIITSPSHLFYIQLFSGVFALGIIPGSAILYKHFPIFKRFTYTSMLYALSRIFMYGITSFGLIYLVKFFGNYGFLILMLPIIIGYGLGLSHFQHLEIKAGNYPKN
jgi:MFS family permease